MSVKNKYMIYRGYIQAVASHGKQLLFTTRHPEDAPMGVYVVDVEQSAPRKLKLPGGGLDLVHDGSAMFVACTDGGVYTAPISGDTLAPLGQALDEAPVSLALTARGTVAAAAGRAVVLLDRASGAVAQTLELPERATVITADASGEWLVVGTDRGTIMVFETEERDSFVLSASAKLHEGEVNALLFETEELRVLSTASDQRLLVTHVRGELEPEDRGGTGMHDKRVLAMVQGPRDRFYTAGLDSTVKAWPSGRNNRRPSTQKEQVVKTNAMALLDYNDAPHLALAGRDQTIRLFPLDEEGKVGEAALILRDGMAWAQNELSNGSPERRERAYRRLAQFNDKQALQLIAQQAGNERDHKLKVLATSLLGETRNARAVPHLEGLLRDSAADVRKEAFEGLRHLVGESEVRPLELALGAGYDNVGKLAISALAVLARGDDKALDMLTGALNHHTVGVRFAAFNALEQHHGAHNPETILIALKSSQEDIQVAAMVRAYQLNQLGEIRVEAALRRMAEDRRSPNVRLHAFLVSLLRRPKLARALRGRDELLNRQLFDVEMFGKPQKQGEVREPPKVPVLPVSELSEQDYRPLLEAMAARAEDTCLRGAHGLALLKDTRAFGTLLQLSRERTDDTRVESCRAFEALQDPRSLKRLRMMLRDGNAKVRDAAFSALHRIESDAPLAAARAGLFAEHQDVRLRGLQVLVAHLKATSPAGEGLELLGRTLHDKFEPVRKEAFKATLSLNVGGSPEAALKFALGSIHNDVRLDVLVEVMAQYEQEWAWTMLIGDMYADPDPTIRSEAFEFALKKARRERRRQCLAAALRCAHADVRLMSVRELTERKLDDFADLIIEALNDDDEQVRQTAVSAMITADARELLSRATKSKHDDIRVRAAVAIAELGDASVRDTLVALASAEEPQKELKEAHRLWLDHVVRALGGLAELGDPAARPTLRGLVESKHAKIRSAAVRALVWTSRADTLDVLREVVRHQDEAVQREAALGLAYYGDSTGEALIFGSSKVDRNEQLLAALGLLEHSEDLFFSFLDESNATLRRRAFLMLLLTELGETDGVPDKCLAALSSGTAEIRFYAARGIEAFTKDGAFEAFVSEMFTTLAQPGNQAWQLPMETIRKLGLAITHGSPQARIRAATAMLEPTQEAFERRWAVYTKRYAATLERLAEQTRTPIEEGDEDRLTMRLSRAWRFVKGHVTGEHKEREAFHDALRQLVFGAYVGLSRKGGEDVLRLGSLERLVAMTQASPRLREDAARVMILSLGDDSATMRLRAFDRLIDLGYNAELLANEALSTSFADMGSRGLQLLAEQGGSGDGTALLRDALLTKTDGLEEEAAKLLAERTSWTETYREGLGAASASMRRKSILSLIKSYEQDDDARVAVFAALRSRFDDVRAEAVTALAQRKVAEAFDTLHELVLSSDGSMQSRGVDGFLALGDTRAAALLLDRIDQDPEHNANTSALMRGVAQLREREVVERLVSMIDRNTHRSEAFTALMAISGHDQSIDDPNDESDDREWLEKQHPRHDDLLARIIDIAYRLADTYTLGRAIPAACWSQTSAVDPVLVPLLSYSNESVQHAAIEAVGWRLLKRGGPAEPLQQVLRGGSPVAQLLAAEGLALAGRADGLTVLLTAVNFMDDYSLRRRAVVALGELAAPQALDLLLGIVEEEYHTLQAPAAEALGRMSKTDRAEDIYKLLVNLSNGGNYETSKSALVGLRWFDTRDAWRVIREKTRSSSWWIRQKAAQLLGECDDPAAVEELARLLREDYDSDVATSAAESLRKIYGPDSLEPDFLLVQGRYSWLTEATRATERLRERGDAGRILEVLPKIQSDNEDAFLKPLVTALLAREPLPLAEVAPLLSSREDRTAQVAAQIVGRGGDAARPYAEHVRAALGTAHAAWLKAFEDTKARRDNAAARLQAAGERYRLMVWTASRLQIARDELIRAFDLPNHPHSKATRAEVLHAVSQPWAGDAGVALLDRAAHDSDADIRTLAATNLAALSPERAQAAVASTLEDGPSLNRLLGRDAALSEAARAALRGAVANIHTQGVALPHLVAARDVAGLRVILEDPSLQDELRLGALEGLARIASPEVEEILAAIGKSEDEDEELRMAAWRALRRARRQRARKTQHAEVR